MKKVIVVTTAALLILNSILGHLISSFSLFNVVYTSIVILLTGTLLFLLQIIRMRDAFTIPLSFMFSVMGIVAYILGLIAPHEIEDNGYIIATIIMITFGFIILLICNITSKSIKR